MKIAALRISAVTACLVATAILGVSSAAAQDTYKLNYFSNNTVAGAPDATVRIDNPGLTYGNLCAMIYTFAADQQMAECCGCLQSHNNLTTYSVSHNLVSPAFTLTGDFTPSGVIKIVSALPDSSGICDPSSTYKPTANLRAWGTHVQNPVTLSLGAATTTVFPTTETPFSDSTLSAAELSALQAQCSFIHILGSGFGICQCGSVFE